MLATLILLICIKNPFCTFNWDEKTAPRPNIESWDYSAMFAFSMPLCGELELL